jgi:hypothetical protein
MRIFFRLCPESVIPIPAHHNYGGTVFSLFALAMLAPVLLALRKSERGLNMPKMNITLLTLLLLLAKGSALDIPSNRGAG